MGTAHTGQIITAAALILIVVAGAFGFSEIVMMKYIAFGLIAALILDATVIRMLLVPSVMALLGDDCWWAPQWMKRVQRKIGLGEIHLPDERPATQARAAAQVTTVIPRITAESTPAFAAAAVEDPALDAMLDSALVMAMTVVAGAQSPQDVDALRRRKVELATLAEASQR